MVRTRTSSCGYKHKGRYMWCRKFCFMAVSNIHNTKMLIDVTVTKKMMEEHNCQPRTIVYRTPGIVAASFV